MPTLPQVHPDPRRAVWAMYLQALAAANVLLPAAIMALGVTGFALGNPLNGWVLPLASVAALCSLRAFTPSWRSAGVAAGLAGLAHLGAFLVANAFFDGSWDGLAYHQEAILRLAAGWNPLFDQSGAYGQGSSIWIDHYPKATWISSAAVHLAGGDLESAKLFNFTLMMAAGAQVASVLLRVTTLPGPVVAATALLAGLNPVMVYQSTTFYVDGVMASVLTVVVAGLTLHLVTPSRAALAVVLLAVCLLINLKFTGLAYAVVLLALAVLVAWWRYGWRSALNLGAVAAATGLLAIFALGYAPYLRNLREKQELFYPVRLLDMSQWQPVNLAGQNRFARFLLASFSRSERVRPPQATRLKFPFWVGAEERGPMWLADVEAGGFGPLYGALLLLAGACWFVLMATPSTRRTGCLVCLLAGCLLASIFVHAETWYARYVPQAWLLPLVVAMGGFFAPKRSVGWWGGGVILTVAWLNVLMVGFYFSREEWAETRAMQRCLREMSSASQGRPVLVYMGPFSSLRERLREGGVPFKRAEAPPLPDERGRPLPAACGQAFWSE